MLVLLEIFYIIIYSLFTDLYNLLNAFFLKCKYIFKLTTTISNNILNYNNFTLLIFQFAAHYQTYLRSVSCIKMRVGTSKRKSVPQLFNILSKNQPASSNTTVAEKCWRHRYNFHSWNSVVTNANPITYNYNRETTWNEKKKQNKKREVKTNWG